MSSLNDWTWRPLCELVAEHGIMLLAGATCLLTVGALAMVCLRAPVLRQRAAEVTILAVLLWLPLACAPLPRISPSEFWRQRTSRPAPVAVRPSKSLEPPTVSHDVRAPQAAMERQPAAAYSQPNIESTPADIAVAATVGGSPPLRAAKLAPTAEATSRAANAETRLALWPAWLAAAYLAGAGACLAWLVVGRLLLAAVLIGSRRGPQWLDDVYQQLPCDGRQRPRLRVSPWRHSAFSCGLWRPLIVLPSRCCRKHRADALRHVLLHELAHLRRRDAWGRLLMNAALPLLYLHPAYWWIRDRHCLAAELVADDWAAGHSSATAYADGLLELVKDMRFQAVNPLGVASVLHSRTQFYRRLEMLVERNSPLATRCSLWWSAGSIAALAAAVALCAATLGVEALPAAQPQVNNQASAAFDVADAAELQSEDESPAEATKTAKPSNAAVDGRLFVHVEEEQTIFMIDAKTGRTMQMVRLRPDAQHVFPGTEQRKFFYSPGDNKMFLIEPDAKEFKPVRLLTLNATSQFELDGKRCLLRPIDGGLEAVETGTDKVLWRTVFRASHSGVTVAESAETTGSIRRGGQLTADDDDSIFTGRQFLAQGQQLAATSADYGGSPAGAGVHVDIVRLATAYSDALAAHDLAKTRYELMEEIKKKQPGVVAGREVITVASEFRSGERKVRLLRDIAEAALQTALGDLEAAKQRLDEASQHKSGALLSRKTQLLQAEGRVKMLKTILAAD